MIDAGGNSGVILSQILQGFAQTISTKETASAADFAAALDRGSQMAYRAVMNPVEGTILTVVKKSAEGKPPTAAAWTCSGSWRQHLKVPLPLWKKPPIYCPN
ncbi:MAG: DAK2 domain-containing protein [Candidatus Syntrophopropionicum ammoniitolerans]